MSSVLPGSGYGPKGAGMEDWSWGMTVDALTVGGHGLRVELEADGHPGYLGTGRMLGEAGLLLAEPGATPERSGCLPRSPSAHRTWRAERADAPSHR
jgi:hypothetical protein